MDYFIYSSSTQKSLPFVFLQNEKTINSDTQFGFLYEIIHLLLMIGLYGNKLTTIITVMALFPRYSYIIPFIIGYFINIFINRKIKVFFKEKRPENETVFYKLEEQEYVKEDLWGFPSGHAQSIGFAFVCLLLFEPKKYIFLITSAIIVVLCLLQRYLYNKHTIQQLLGGLFFGSLFAIIFFLFTTYIVRRYMRVF